MSNKASKSFFSISDLVALHISMTIPHCICCPSCHLEIHSNMMCFVCLTLEHRLPRGQVTSSLWSVLCSFLCRSMPWDCPPTTHSLCLTYVDVGPIFIQYICFMSVCAGHLSQRVHCYRPGSNCICKLYQMDGGYRFLSLACTALQRQTANCTAKLKKDSWHYT